MLSFRKGAAGAAGAAGAMAAYLGEQAMPPEMVKMADYYLRGVVRSEAEGTAAIPRQDMPIHVAEALGLDLTRTATRDEMTNLLRGLRADGAEIEGKASYKPQVGKDRIGYVDFTFSAPKSVSVAMALAPTDAERHIIVGAHRDAWMAGMAHLETLIGHARKGDGGSKGSIPGKLAWVSFDHYTARPTIDIPHTEADGTKTTLIQTVHNPKVAADMQLHTHVATPNVVFANDGSVGSMDMLALHDRVHEVGAYYQAHLATNLRAHGIDVVLDDKTEAARLTAVPEAVSDLFSKRSRDGEVEARKMVAGMGLDWDALHPLELAGIMTRGTKSVRQSKASGGTETGVSDLAAWQGQAKAAGYEHQSVIDPGVKARLPASEQERLLRGYQAALPVLDRQFTSRATMLASVARTAAARGLIASGVEDASDIDRITAVMREHGVQHGGQVVPLVWADAATESADGAAAGRRGRVKITTTLHLEQEREAMTLAAKAAADKSGALTPGQIDRAVRDVTARDGLDFTSEHGLAQRRIIDTLGTSGRLAVAVGVAGAGKSTLLRPLVEAWTAPTEREGDERKVYGTALATRQAVALADAGIEPRNTMPMAGLLGRAADGRLNLDERSVVVVDELGQIGTAQMLGLLRLQAERGFSIVGIGDDRQGQAIEAGSTIRLVQNALGTGAVPELGSTVRQLRERDRTTSLLFRAGDAEAGIGRMREDGHAILVQGGRRQAVEATADLWAKRHEANAGRDGYTLTVSAPTNEDARAIGAAIRERRRAAGQIGPDQVVIQATDQAGARYELPLATGDRVRLFARTPASFSGKGGNLGNNGSVVEVERIEDAGLQLRNTHGNSGFVRWDTLRNRESGRIRLTYGDVLSIDAIQGNTSTEHIDAMPSGSAAVNSFKSYVAKSRSREETWLVVADGRERAEIMERRALGTALPVAEDDVWRNIARNLSRQPEKELATVLLDRADSVQTGVVRSLATAFQPVEQRRADGKEGATPYPAAAATRQADTETGQAAPAMRDAAERSAAAAGSVALGTARPGRNEAREVVQEARRSTRAPAQRPKRGQAERPRIHAPSATDVQAEFAEALHRAGLRPRGAPIMDGEWHRTEVEGAKRGRLSGSYIGHTDGMPAGYILNRKTGRKETWRASSLPREQTAAERAQEHRRVTAARVTREAERSTKQGSAAARAASLWDHTAPAPASHPYLARKGIGAHGARRDGKNLAVPMRDIDGKLWGVQTVKPDGGKLFIAGGRVQGTFATLGELRPGEPVIIAEGFATAATMREATGLTVLAAFDSGNLMEVARAVRRVDPARLIVMAADNDHHLPRRPVPLPNVGAEKAQTAAEAVGGIVLMPRFAPADLGTDWNDYAAQHSKDAVRKIVQDALEGHGIAVPGVSQAQRDAARQRAPGGPQPGGEDPARAAQEAARRAQERGPSNGPHL